MRTAGIATFALSLTAATALAQSTSGTSTTPGTTSLGSSVGRGAPALAPKPSGPVAPSRSNTEVFPPVAAVAANWRGGFDAADPDNRQHQRGNDIRNRNRDHRSVHEQGGTSTTSGDASTATSDTSTSGTQTNGNTTATASDGQSNAGGTAGLIRPIPPNSQTSSGSGTGQPFSTRTGKNALNETVADCMKIWEPATHMSKADWQRTCRRVQGRLDQVTREVLEK